MVQAFLGQTAFLSCSNHDSISCKSSGKPQQKISSYNFWIKRVILFAVGNKIKNVKKQLFSSKWPVLYPLTPLLVPLVEELFWDFPYL